jgi:hypothetical protein
MGGSGNKFIPILGAVAVAFLLLVFLGRGKKTETAVPPAAPRTAPAPDADTGADTLRAMAEQMRQMREESEAARKENERLRTEQAESLVRLKAELESQSAKARQADQEHLSGQLDELMRRLGPGGARGPNPGAGSPLQGLPDLPIGSPGLPAEQGVVWVEPLDRKGAGTAVPVSATNGSLLHDGAPPAAPVKPPEPAYTVPRNATLLGSTAMTALIGRVPIRGQVEDPFPFKVLVGKDNLAANGLEIPSVYGMVFSGTAFGDWTLGCVRGYVDAVTFVFDDGTIRTQASGGGGQGGGATTASSSAGSGGLGATSGTGTAVGAGAVHHGLGWISDRRGIPCVSGVRISNAVDYLGGRMLARGLETAGQAYARSQQTITTTPLGGYTSAVTGSVGEYALGQTVSGSADELAKFIAERQAQMFDVVYVDTGAEVAVHIDREIPIDYEPHGRKLDYARASATPSRSGRGGLD